MMLEFQVATCVWSYPDALRRAPSHACLVGDVSSGFRFRAQFANSRIWRFQATGVELTNLGRNL